MTITARRELWAASARREHLAVTLPPAAALALPRAYVIVRNECLTGLIEGLIVGAGSPNTIYWYATRRLAERVLAQQPFGKWRDRIVAVDFQITKGRHVSTR